MTIQRLAERQIKNFVKADVVNTFTGMTTSFTVGSGQGSRFPTPPYALVLYDSRFIDPADAYWQGAAEVILVTGRTSDVLTVVRGVDATTPFSSESGKQYKLILPASHYFLENVPRYLNVKAYGATGDGITNDTVAILAAYADMPADGGVLFFPRGTYVLTQSKSGSDKLIIDKSHVALIGEAGSIIKGDDGADAQSQLIRIEGETDEYVEDVLIQGLEFNGNATEASIGSASQAHIINVMNARRVTVERCRAYDCPGDFVRTDFEDADFPIEDLIVRQNHVDGCLRNCVSITLCNRFRVEGNVLHGFNTVGVDVEPNNEGDTCRDGVVARNHIMAAAERLNTFNSNRLYGISLKAQSVDDATSNVVVSENTIVGRTADDDALEYPVTGINLALWRGATVKGNQVIGTRQGISSGSDPGSSAGEGSSGEITGNYVRGCKTAAGVGISSKSNMLIQGNTVEYCEGAGIRIAGRGNSVQGNTVRHNNQVADPDFPGGIYCEGFDNLLSTNQCSDFLAKTDVTLEKAGTTITVTHEAHGHVTGDFVRFSDFPDSTYGGVDDYDGGAHEITVTGVDTYTYELDVEPDNESTTAKAWFPTQLYGIYCEDSSKGNLISDNDVRENLLGGIRLKSTQLGFNDVRSNLGFITEFRGTSAVISGTTSIAVQHFCKRTPGKNEILIIGIDTCTSDPGNIWIHPVTATHFTVNCRNNPGASGFEFSWAIVQRSYGY